MNVVARIRRASILSVCTLAACASAPTPAPPPPLSDDEACVRANHNTTIAFALQDGVSREAAEANFAKGLGELRALCARPIAHEPDQQKQYRCLAAAETPAALQACLEQL